MNDYINVDITNIDKEHICCALSGKEADTKKAWMKQQFEHGYTFLKRNVRGKVFIDYVPSEYAYAPIDSVNMMYIYCLWVSGKWANHGYARELLELAEKDAIQKGKDGMILISSKSKKPFLADCAYMMKQGYRIVDEGYDEYLLLYKPLNDNAVIPHFNGNAKHREKDNSGFVLYYNNRCVFSEKYVQQVDEEAKKRGWDLKIIKLDTIEKVNKYGVISSAYSLFYNNVCVAQEILSVAKFVKLVEQQMK